MRITILVWMAMAAFGAVDSAGAQGHQGGPPILGYRVVLEADDGGRTSGELIAVSLDSLWLLHDDALTVFPLADMKQVNIRQSSFGAGKALLWSLIAGAISGVALTAACSSLDGDCGAVLPAVLISWAFIGGIAALAVEPARYTEFPAPRADVLRPYSRFPQGLPEGYRSEGSATETSENGSGSAR
jgi:hypothetical protein